MVHALRSSHPLTLLLRAARLSRSTFYYHAKREKAVDKYAGLKTRIRQVYTSHKGRYGYRRITDALRLTGERINHKTVQRMMQALGL